MQENLWLIPLFPALGAVVNGLFGRWTGSRRAGAIACIASGLSFAAALWVFFSLLSLEPSDRSIHHTLYTWIASGDFVIKASLLLDPLSAAMILVVTGVGFVIHV